MREVRSCCSRRGGLTLTEVVVATAIVGFMLVGALNSVGAVFRTRKLNAQPLSGVGLAQQLMDEAIAMPYEDPQNPGGSLGINAGESNASRADFDDVDDYHNWSSNDGRSKAGVALPGFTGWQCGVQVAWADVATPTANSGVDAGLKRVQVTVTSPTGAVTSLQALRARYGSLEQKPGVAASAVTAVNAALRLGAATTAEQWSGRPSNHADDVN